MLQEEWALWPYSQSYEESIQHITILYDVSFLFFIDTIPKNSSVFCLPTVYSHYFTSDNSDYQICVWVFP